MNFSTLDLAYYSVSYNNFSSLSVLLLTRVGFQLSIVAVEFRIDALCVAMCAFFYFTSPSPTLSELLKKKGPEPRKDHLLWFSDHAYTFYVFQSATNN